MRNSSLEISPFMRLYLPDMGGLIVSVLDLLLLFLYASFRESTSFLL